jgi:superfamily II DNA or RNA helicase
MLRDYQRALLSSISRRFESGHTSVLAYLPTGGGKTHVAAAHVAVELRIGGRALIVVNSRTLLEQTRRALLRLGFGGEMIGVVGGGEEPQWRRPLQVIGAPCAMNGASPLPWLTLLSLTS